MVQINVTIAARPDEFARQQIALLRDHFGQKRVAGNIKRNSQKAVSRALIELTRKFSVRDVKLKKQMN